MERSTPNRIESWVRLAATRGLLVAALISALAVIAGALGPWVQDYETERHLVDGLDRDGVATLCAGIGAVLAAIAALVWRRLAVIATPVLAACGAATVALALDNMAEIRDENHFAGIKPVLDVEPAWGLLLTALAGTLLFIAALVVAVRLAPVSAPT